MTAHPPKLAWVRFDFNKAECCRLVSQISEKLKTKNGITIIDFTPEHDKDFSPNQWYFSKWVTDDNDFDHATKWSKITILRLGDIEEEVSCNNSRKRYASTKYIPSESSFEDKDVVTNSQNTKVMKKCKATALKTRANSVLEKVQSSSKLTSVDNDSNDVSCNSQDTMKSFKANASKKRANSVLNKVNSVNNVTPFVDASEFNENENINNVDNLKEAHVLLQRVDHDNEEKKSCTSDDSDVYEKPVELYRKLKQQNEILKEKERKRKCNVLSDTEIESDTWSTTSDTRTQAQSKSLLKQRAPKRRRAQVPRNRAKAETSTTSRTPRTPMTPTTRRTPRSPRTPMTPRTGRTPRTPRTLTTPTSPRNRRTPRTPRTPTSSTNRWTPRTHTIPTISNVNARPNMCGTNSNTGKNASSSQSRLVPPRSTFRGTPIDNADVHSDGNESNADEQSIGNNAMTSPVDGLSPSPDTPPTPTPGTRSRNCERNNKTTRNDHDEQTPVRANHSNEEEEDLEAENSPNKKRHYGRNLQTFISDCIRYYKKGEPGYAERKNDRYKISDRNEKIYLGEGIKVNLLYWQLIYEHKASIFLREMVLLLWDEDDLSNRALDITHKMEPIPNRSPVKLIQKNILRLCISSISYASLYFSFIISSLNFLVQKLHHFSFILFLHLLLKLPTVYYFSYPDKRRLYS